MSKKLKKLKEILESELYEVSTRSIHLTASGYEHVKRAVVEKVLKSVIDRIVELDEEPKKTTNESKPLREGSTKCNCKKGSKKKGRQAPPPPRPKIIGDVTVIPYRTGATSATINWSESK